MSTEKLKQLESVLNNLTPTDFIRLDNSQLLTIEKLSEKLADQVEAQKLYRGLNQKAA